MATLFTFNLEQLHGFTLIIFIMRKFYISQDIAYLSGLGYMIKTKTNYHISKESAALPSLQKAILINLAEKGPQTINETVQNIKHHYKPTWIAFDSLEKKGLIQKVDTKTYRGREYPKYWLTVLGQITALFNDANVEDLKQNALKFCKDNEEKEALEVFLDMAKSLGPETTKKMYKFLLTGDFELSFLPIDETEIYKALNIAKKYPKYWKFTEEKIERMREALEKVLGYE